VYCKVPFKAKSKTNPIIGKYVKIIGRLSSASKMLLKTTFLTIPNLIQQVQPDTNLVVFMKLMDKSFLT